MKQAVTIIIVDDHPLFRRGLREAIQEDPRFKVIGEVGDGEEAMRLLTELKPDLAVVDIDMPRLSGLEMVRALNTMNFLIPILILTMYKDDGMFNAAMDLGVRAYVLKENAAGEILMALDLVADGGMFVSSPMSIIGRRRIERAQELLLSKPQIEELTPAERRILKHIADDRTSKEIADFLEISVRTVEHHRSNICQKLNIHGSHSLLKFAFANRALL
jgi:DNA-binding NarL/FixJ family response regulator